MGALPNVASSRRYHRTDWRKEKWVQGAKLGLDGRDRIIEGWVSTSVILQDHNLAKVGVEGSKSLRPLQFFQYPSDLTCDNWSRPFAVPKTVPKAWRYAAKLVANGPIAEASGEKPRRRGHQNQPAPSLPNVSSVRSE
jgi:hypothetical protein